MDIHIEMASIDPPEGRTCREGHRDWLPFVGWLELISSIERLVDAARRPLPDGVRGSGVDGLGAEEQT